MQHLGIFHCNSLPHLNLFHTVIKEHFSLLSVEIKNFKNLYFVKKNPKPICVQYMTGNTCITCRLTQILCNMFNIVIIKKIKLINTHIL